MKVIAIIPARYSSTRFPGKVISPIAGVPMIQRVWERTRKASRIDEVIIATDDDRVKKLVEGFGGHAIMTSSDHPSGTERVFGGHAIMTSSDHPSGTERVAEAASKIEGDVIVNVQGDEPLIEPESLNLAVQPFLTEDNINVTSLMHPIESYSEYINPNVVKVLCDEIGNALYFSRAPIPFYRDEKELLDKWDREGARPAELKPVPQKHIGVYAFEADLLQALVRMPRSTLEEAEKLEQLRVLGWGFGMKMVPTPHDSISVDVPEDVEKVENLIKQSSG
jgi:3-deoxy-manno-octulosonate cytidylyltransferase (CMP-KDO synthetase)